MKYLAITAILCLILAGASFAGNVTMTDVITGADLTLTMPNDFSIPSVTLGGSSAKFSDSVGQTFTIEDSRGNGAGWNLTFQVSQFQTGGTPNRTLFQVGIGQYEVSLDNSDIARVYGQAVEGTFHGPYSKISSYTWYYANPDYVLEVIESAADHGMGKYTALTYHRMGILAACYAGTYTGILTATLNNVP